MEELKINQRRRRVLDRMICAEISQNLLGGYFSVMYKMFTFIAQLFSYIMLNFKSDVKTSKIAVISALNYI